MESNRDYVREVLMLGPIYQCFSLLTVNVSLVIICLSLYVKGTSICMCLLIFVGDSYIPPESALRNKPPCTFFLSLSGLRADAGDENNPGWVRVQSGMECPYRAPRSLLAKNLSLNEHGQVQLVRELALGVGRDVLELG